MKGKTIIIDLDGTLSNSVQRIKLVSENPKDYEQFYKRISEDTPNKWATKILELIDHYNFSCDNKEEIRIILLTGRPEWTRKTTIEWLNKHTILKPYDYDLIMREDKDYRHDYDYKRERIKEIKKKHKILFSIDDRPGPWRAFRDEGITCLFCGVIE